MHSSAQVHRTTSDQSFSIKIARRKIVKDHCAFENEISKSTMGRGSVKKNTGGVVTLKRDLRSKNERDGWSSMILGHYKWESNGVTVHTMGKGIGRAKPQSGGNRGNSRVIFQRRIRHNRRRTICQNVNLCSLFWFNWKELIIMAHCSAFSLFFNHFHYLCYLFVIFSK